MNDESMLTGSSFAAAAADVLMMAREQDPTVLPEAVRRFVTEIAAAERVLSRVDVETISLATRFSPAWQTGANQ